MGEKVFLITTDAYTKYTKCNNEGRNKCNNKTPLNYDSGTLYLLFTFYLQIRSKKPYTKTPRVKV